MTKAKSNPPSKGKAAPTPAEAAKAAADKSRASRETVESIVVAVILAFLFRAFEAEAFVIPTGSMAPTLQGRHADIECPKCKYRYQAGCSEQQHTLLTSATCPICRYNTKLDMQLGWITRAEHGPFDGDRILVSKFAYEIGEPQRWDVIVFKYPGNAKVNYIKRLVGLPGERVRIQNGNIYKRTKDNPKFSIARKPPQKVVAMLQVVDDTQHIPEEFVKAGWPSRWFSWSSAAPQKDSTWAGDGYQSFTTDGTAPGEAWLRYRHAVPSKDDWKQLEQGIKPADADGRDTPLITDVYAYNCGEGELGGPSDMSLMGRHWVGDLAVECLANVESDSGELLLDLVKSGSHYQCRIDVATGTATLSIDGEFSQFQGEKAAATGHPAALKTLRGKGTYRLRFANVDDQLFLWVNGSPIANFDQPTTYGAFQFDQPPDMKPVSTDEDPGDWAPAGVGTKGAAATFSKLRILRDVYYIADNNGKKEGINGAKSVEFPDDGNQKSYLEHDQFFPCGDNSPFSQDARLWMGADKAAAPNPYVERKLLIGKALLIYWPHTWNRPVPFTPNPQRMKFIR